jgi:hypothetical protein
VNSQKQQQGNGADALHLKDTHGWLLCLEE